MSWFGYGCGHRARDPGSLQRPQASRAETKELDGDKLETPVMPLQGLQRGPGAAGRQSCETGPLHAPDAAIPAKVRTL